MQTFAALAAVDGIIGARVFYLLEHDPGTLLASAHLISGNAFTFDGGVTIDVADAHTAPEKLTHRRLDLGADPHETARQPRWQGDPLHLADCLTAIQSRRHQALKRTTPTHYDPGPPPNPN